jgi:hypothetical protein
MNGLYLLAAFGALAVVRTLVVGVAWCLRDARANQATRTQVGRIGGPAMSGPRFVVLINEVNYSPHFPPAAGAAPRDGQAHRPPLDGFVAEVA